MGQRSVSLSTEETLRFQQLSATLIPEFIGPENKLRREDMKRSLAGSLLLVLAASLFVAAENDSQRAFEKMKSLEAKKSIINL